MAIPTDITDALDSLKAQVAAAEPITAASRPVIVACQLNARALVEATEAAQTTLAGVLDTWTAPTDPEQIISGVLGLYGNAVDERDIALMRGLVGRAASNLDQLP